MKILVACEFSGRVREAFNARGHKATSADFEPSELPGDHYRGNVLDIIDDKWDMMLAFPPCTYLAVSGARWNKYRVNKTLEAVEFVKTLWNSPIEKVAIENPIGRLSTLWEKPDQIIQPYWFGDEVRKSTCLWLGNLPRLTPTKFVSFTDKIHLESPGPNRQKNRSRTFPGVASAMAAQWG